MKRGRGFIIFFIAVFACLVSFYFDSQISMLLSLSRSYLLDKVFLGFTFISSGIIIFFFLTSLFLWQEHKRRWILPLWLTLGLSAILSVMLKFSIQRARPFQQGIVTASEIFMEHSHIVWNFSFPSFQAIMAFSAVPILCREFPRFRYVWVGFAAIVAISRVYFGLHFMSDVIAGGIIGYVIGLIVMRYQIETNFGEIYKKIFEKLA